MNNVPDRRNVCARLLATALMLLIAAPLVAHEQKVALTDILYNQRTGNLEIAHRFSIHDAEHALHKATELKGDLARSSKAREAFAKYVAKRFSLTRSDKRKLKLSLVGQEIEGGYLWVYQETRIPKPANASFYIQNGILHDVVRGQINTVNVRNGSNVSTFQFGMNTRPKLYRKPSKPTSPKEGSKKVQ